MKIAVLIDNHLPVDLEDYPLPELNRAALHEFLRDLRPERVTAFAYGHDGWAQYPSSNNESPPGLKIDLLAMWSELAREAGCDFNIYVSTLINLRLMRREPSWERTGLENNPTRRLDHTSPIFEAWLKPVLLEIIDKYHPDGFFFDGDYWTVGESLSPIRFPAAKSIFPHLSGLDISLLRPEEHRELTVRSYDAYLAKIADFLKDRAPKSSINLAYSMRHPVNRPPGLDLTTSDLPPFFAALDCWFETAVLPGECGEREVLVPLFVEPEGGGRKYTKSPRQVVQEISPIIAMGEALHVYFPMSQQGRLDVSYLSLLKQVQKEVDTVAPVVSNETFPFCPDVISLADEGDLCQSQDFAGLRGAALLASIAGLNIGIANTSRCLSILPHLRLILAPIRLSDLASACVEQAKQSGVVVYQKDFSPFNSVLNNVDLVEINSAYSKGRSSWSSRFKIKRPACVFLRGFRKGEQWRIFFFNSCERGSALGRHVTSGGAGYAGKVVVYLPDNARLERIEGYAINLNEEGRFISFDLADAFAVIEGRFIACNL